MPVALLSSSVAAHLPCTAVLPSGRQPVARRTPVCFKTFPSTLTLRQDRHVSRAPRSTTVVRAIFEKFTERAIKVVMTAQTEAKLGQAAEVGTEHLLLGMIAEDSGQPAFYGSGLALEAAREAVQRISGRRKQKVENAHELPFSRNSKSIFEAALLESKAMGMNFIAPEHICLAVLASVNTGAIKVLRELGVSSETAKTEATRRLKGEQEGDAKKKKTPAASKDNTKALEQFCRDLTAEAATGRIDPVIGREQEIYRVCQILARRRKNNPILLGEAGVGKTAIAEGLAVCIATNGAIGGLPMPSMLKGVRVMQLDVGLLLAGAKERGELESRVTKILAECKAAGPSVVLAIDEIHTLVGAGSVGRSGSGGGLDISNLIKPALAAGELRCIGATTLDEHRSHIEKDPALSRRFQPVIVDEPSEAEAIEILEGLQSRYEHHHHCSYTAGAIEAAVKLAIRYVPDRFLPDKAIDLMDEAGSRARITAHFARAKRAGSPDMQQYEELLQVMDSKEEAIRAGLFEEAGLLRERELDLKATLVAPPEQATSVSLVDTAAIEKIVAMWSGIPVERMTQNDMKLLRGLGDQLQSRVIGQPDAIQSVTLALQRARCGMRDPKRPIATLLFSGPTGVGKSSLVSCLAEQYFGTPDALIRLDMSEYMERHTVSKLIGSPPGYIGFGEGGKLTEAVRRRPFSLLLLDEVEKAHPDVFHMMLQIMEDGRLTDSRGRVVSFKNCLIVMTSNIGSNVIAKGANAMGFQVEDEGGSSAARQVRIRSLVMEELKSFFRPELLNRIDEIVVFNPLEDRHVHSIASTMLSETVSRVATLGVRLEITEAAMALVCSQGFAIDQGARQLRRTITSLIEDKLSDAILSRGVTAGQTVIIDAELGEIAVITDAADPRVAGQGTEFVDFELGEDVSVVQPEVVKADA